MPNRFVFLIAAAIAVAFSRGTRADDFEQPEPLDPQVAEASPEASQAMSGIRLPENW